RNSGGDAAAAGPISRGPANLELTRLQTSLRYRAARGRGGNGAGGGAAGAAPLRQAAVDVVPRRSGVPLAGGVRRRCHDTGRGGGASASLARARLTTFNAQ